MPMHHRHSYHVWHTDTLDIFQAAQAQEAPVALKCRMRLDAAKWSDVVLRGKIASVRGHMVRFRTDSHSCSAGERAPADPACAYAFAVDMPYALGEDIRVEYEGRALILDRAPSSGNVPEILELRVSLPSKIRRQRRHDRVACGPGRVEAERLVLVEARPRRIPDLERLLEAPDEHGAPQLLNLSASGACLLAGTAIRQKLMAVQERYLVSFRPLTPERAARPLAFLGRKVGVFPRRDGPSALRIRFFEELEWKESGLDWHNIERKGSAALARLLGHWQELDAAAEAARAAEAAKREQARGAALGAAPLNFDDLGFSVSFLDEADH